MVDNIRGPPQTIIKSIEPTQNIRRQRELYFTVDNLFVIGIVWSEEFPDNEKNIKTTSLESKLECNGIGKPSHLFDDSIDSVN
jgi:hypothetical protein